MRLRPAARALICTPDHHLLLVKFIFPDLTFWAPPGGGIEDGESVVDALTRELREEVGLTDPSIGPCIYEHRRRYGPDARSAWDGQADDAFLVRVPERFEPRPGMTEAELRAENLHGIGWFDIPALESLPTMPSMLARVMRDLASTGVPATPRRIEEL